MQVFQRNERPGVGIPETTGRADLRNAGGHPHTFEGDSGITYLYRSGQSQPNTPSRSEQQSLGDSPSRRYDQTTYLQIDWESLRHSSEEFPKGASTSSSRGLANVYARVLERAENKLGADVVADLLLLIHCSRNGLSTDELVAISGHSPETVASLCAMLQNHVMPKGGRVCLLNAYIARAIVARYGGLSGAGLTEGRERIAAFFEEQELSLRVAEELPWQLLELGALDRLQSCVIDAGVATALCNAGRRGDLCLYWNALEGRVNLAQSYGSSLKETSEAGKSELFALLARYYSLAAADSSVDSAKVATLFGERTTAWSGGAIYAS